MFYPVTSIPSNLSFGYHLPAEDEGNQTVDNEIILDEVQDANNQTNDKEIILNRVQDASTETDNEIIILNRARDASTQTDDNEIILNQVQDASTQTDNEIIILNQARDANNQTNDNEIIILNKPRDASTQTDDKEVILIPVRSTSTQTIVEDFIYSGTMTRDPEGSKRKIGVIIDDILAVPGPSRPSEKVTQSKFCKVDLQNRLIDRSVKNMKTVCFDCNKNISEHGEVHKGMKTLRCCQCNFVCNEDDHLLKHLCAVHFVKPFFCNICNVRYAEADSHQSEYTCDVCKTKFQCKTGLEDHYPAHDEYHLKYCRICKQDIYNHCYEHEGKSIFKCCFKCSPEFIKKSSFQSHLITHSILKPYKCDYCEKRFKRKAERGEHYKRHFKS